MQVAPFPVALAIETQHKVVVMHQLRAMADGKDGDAETFAILIDLAFDIHTHGTGAFVLRVTSQESAIDRRRGAEVVVVHTRIPKSGR
jgi:hypothetical protein